MLIARMEIDLKGLQLNAQPQVIAAILKLRDDNTDLNFNGLETLLKTDQNMAAWILKVANSPFYNRGNKIQTLKQAIGLLGFKLVRSMCLVLTSKSIFEGGQYTRFRKYVWEHSVVTGIYARSLAIKVRIEDAADEIFVAALLHDIGKAILNALDRKKFIEVLDLATVDTTKTFAQAETEKFGFDHMQVGLKAAVEWNLPAIFHPIIAYHENLAGAAALSPEEKRATHLVAYANALANRAGYGHYVSEFDDIAEECEKFLGVSDQVRNYFSGAFVKEIKEDDLYKSFFSLT